ncbi:MAG: tyrosine-type recombinase/integrase [Chloroflexi bacterium]|nr:tyrosine-type recombinase/integrase [Chloroflexota bacterium]
MCPQIDIFNLQVASDWHIDFGLWLRQTPTQKRRERSQLSVSAYTSDIEQMSRWFAGRYEIEFAPDHLNSANLQEYFGGMECAPATYNRRLASARMLIKWLRSVNVLDYDPSEWIPLQDATRESPRDVNEDDRVMLELAAEEGEGSLIGLRDSLIFFLMSNAGMRISEVVKLLLSDLHLDDGYIHVLGKGMKHRKIKIGGRLVVKINAWLSRMPKSIEGTLITDEYGLSIGRGQAWRRFCLIAETAGVKVTPHEMRHTFVLRYMDAVMGGDPSKLPAAIDAVCQQMGDRPEVILAYYTRARESDMRAAAEVM